MSVLESIDLLSNVKPQNFSLPNPLIVYMFNYSRLVLSQKFIKSCKYFKFLHLKKNESHLEVLTIYDHAFMVSGGLVEIQISRANSRGKYEFKTIMKSIKILDTFMFRTYHSDCFSSVMEKLDLCQTKIINITARNSLGEEILKKIINSSLEELTLSCRSNKNVNPALLAFQRCPKIKILRVYFNDADSTVPMINSGILKEIVKTKREDKIMNVSVNHIFQVNKDDFIKFLKIHMAAKSDIDLTTERIEGFNELNQMLDKIEKISQPNQWKKIAVYFLGQSSVKYL